MASLDEKESIPMSQEKNEQVVVVVVSSQPPKVGDVTILTNNDANKVKRNNRKRGVPLVASAAAAGVGQQQRQQRQQQQRRRSKRGDDGLKLIELATLMCASDYSRKQNRILVITGAGLSVPSGIRPFRGTGDAVWSQVIYTMATRAAFRADPLSWYNDFWLPHFGSGVSTSSSPSSSRSMSNSSVSFSDKNHHGSTLTQRSHYSNQTDVTKQKMATQNNQQQQQQQQQYQPNEGHEALAKLCHMFGTDGMHVITQNIDGLHQATRQPWNHKEQLIECHGRLGLSKCCPETDSDTDSHSSSDDNDDNDDNDCIDPSFDNNDNKKKNN
eukprot:scaffold58793_cov35-Attheya_sp.AAC.2